MSRPVDVLAVMDAHVAERASLLACLHEEIANGDVTHYEKELADLESWRREAIEARAAVVNLLNCTEATVRAFEALGRSGSVMAQIEAHRECERALVEQKRAITRVNPMTREQQAAETEKRG